MEDNMKSLRKLLVGLLAILIILAMTACGSGGSSDQQGNSGDSGNGEQQTRKKIVMGTNAEFEPFEYHDQNEIVGIDVEIAKAIAADLGAELVIEDMNFDSLLGALATDKVDFVAAGMTVTDERKENADFSVNYFDASQVIIVKKGSDIKSDADLVGKRIGVQLGTTGDLLASEIKDAKVERYNKGFEAVSALNAGQIDCVVIDNFPAQAFVAKNSDLVILDKDLSVEQYAIAVKKGNTELLNSINATLKRLQDSGELQKIFDKYIKVETSEA